MGIKNKINSFRKARANVVYNRFAKNLNDFAVDDTWNSSAQNLENKKVGIIPPFLYTFSPAKALICLYLSFSEPDHNSYPKPTNQEQA